MRKRFEVVFETSVFRSVFVDADDEGEAQEIAIEREFPGLISLPNGYELDDNWFVGGITRVRDDD